LTPVFGAVDRPSAMGEMEALIDSLDWSRTSIGSRENWSPALKTTVRILVANRFPMLLWWGPDYICIYNDAYIPILGKKHPWALGKPVRECWAEIWEVLRPLIDTPFEGGPATWSEDIELHINRSGFTEETHFTVAYSPVPDETAPRGIGGVLATVNEITAKIIGQRRSTVLRELASAVEAKTAEEASINAAAKLAAHGKDIPFALIYLCGEEGSAVLAAATGIGDALMLAPATIRMDDPSAVWPFAEVQAAGQILRMDLPPRIAETPNGRWPDPPQQAAVLPIRSQMAHRFAGFLVVGLSSRLSFDEAYVDFLNLLTSQIATAISTARAYEEERRRAEALAEIDRAKTAFFSNVSHEFRTPLTLMLGPLEQMIRQEDLGAASRERVEVAHRNSLRLLKLVNSLLDFSRIEAGRIRASYAPADLAAVTADIASSFRSTMEAGGVRFDVKCGALDEPVYVDVEMWEKIVLNLLSNAFKFTFDGEVVVTLEQAGRYAVLNVSDTGTGIPDTELPHIFERFHRVEGARGRSYEGTGIGLALVQELVRMHGGTVTVQSQAGKGSVFTVRIPFGHEHLPADRVMASTADAASFAHTEAYVEEALRWLPKIAASRESVWQGSTETNSAVGHRPRVLLADDNADMRDYIVRLLGHEMQVTAVSNGQEALASASQEPPNLVLTDVMMPVLNGFELLRELRGNPKTADIPVILLSARAGEESRIEGVSAGADDYLVKPFSAGELLARVTTHLKLARARQQSMKMMRRLQDISTRLIGESDLATMLGEFLDAAIEVTGADMGNIQLLDSATGELRIVAHRGFDAPFLEFFSRVRDGAAACGKAMQERRRIIVEDVSSSPVYDDESRRVMLAAGAKAVQSTPFLTRSGKTLGMFSTHFRSRCRPGDHDLQLMDVLARQATDLIERELADLELRRNNSKLSRDLDALNRMHELSTRELGSRSLESLLQEIMDTAVAIVRSDMGTLQLVEGDTLRIVAHAGHRQPFLDFFAAAETRESVCGEALKQSSRVLVEDVEASPIFAGSPSLAVLRNAGVRAVQSTPLFTRGGKLLGVLTTQWGTPHTPDEHDLWRLDLLARQAADLIENAIGAGLLRASEERFRALVTASSDVVYQMSGDWSEMRHLEGREFISDTLEPSKTWLDKYIHPDDQAYVTQKIGEAIRSRSVFALEHRVIRSDGTLGWTFSRAVPMLNDAGEIIEWFGAASDITSLKSAEKALRASDERFRQLVEIGPQIIWLSGPRGELEFVNRRWMEYSGLDLEGTRDPAQVRFRLHPDDDVLGHWRECVAAGKAFELEARLRRRDGEFRWFMMRSLPVRDEHGQIQQWFGTSTDIHESKLLQLELQRANQDLEQFAYSASHDLQEPLRSVKIFSELVVNGYADQLDERAREFLSNVQEGAGRMETLVRDLLT
jgi:PAS domain S-box-containing protein